MGDQDNLSNKVAPITICWIIQKHKRGTGNFQKVDHGLISIDKTGLLDSPHYRSKAKWSLNKERKNVQGPLKKFHQIGQQIYK